MIHLRSFLIPSNVSPEKGWIAIPTDLNMSIEQSELSPRSNSMQ